jgi:hypothetical protein
LIGVVCTLARGASHCASRGRRVTNDKHSTDVESPPPPPRVCLCYHYHPECQSCRLVRSRVECLFSMTLL